MTLAVPEKAPRRHYVYIWHVGRSRYVGSGTRFRAWTHLRLKRGAGPSQHIRNAHLKGQPLKVEIVADNLSGEDAARLERSTIARLYGDASVKLLNVYSVPKVKQSTRMIRCQCPTCGYTLRTTRQWLTKSVPVCGTCNISFEVR
jgi:hypothetical protein